MNPQHYKNLQQMYLQAPLHGFYDTLAIEIEKGKAIITLECDTKYFHAGGSMHGSVIFKLLDDAAFFAAQSLISDVFVLTYNFNIHLIRPVSNGKLTATGIVKFSSGNLIVAEAHVINQIGKEVAFGTGDFIKSKKLLNDIDGYSK